MADPDRVPVQVQRGSRFRRFLADTEGATSIPRTVSDAAYQGYLADGGPQDLAPILERGGFDIADLGYLIVRAADEGRVTITVTPPAPPPAPAA